MTKVAIKNENITSYGGIYHIMDVFSKLGFEKIKPTTLRSSLNKHHFFVVFHTSPLVWVGDFMLRKAPRTPENPYING